MRGRLESADWLEAADRLAAGFFAIFVAVAGVTKSTGGPTWLAIALATLGVAGAVVTFALKGLHERAKRRGEGAALLALPPVRMLDAAASGAFYRMGVDAEAEEALAALGAEAAHAPYLERDIDEELRSVLRDALTGRRATLIVLSGRSKTGKSRTLLEAAAAERGQAWLLAPRDPPALAVLAHGGPPSDVGSGPYVIWLDDIEPWARPGTQGLNPQTLEAFDGWNQPVLVLAAEGGKGIDLAGPEGRQFHEIARDLVIRARQLRLDPEVTRHESARIRERFEPEVAARIERDGIGEFMIAAPRLIARLETDRDCLEGQAVVQAAIDCRRSGLLRPLHAEWLGALYGHYLRVPATPEAFARGLAWATHPLFARTALLSRTDDGGYMAYDYIVDYAARRGRPINPTVWDRVVDEYADTEADLLTVSTVAYRAGDWRRAERAARRADALGSPEGALKLGVLLEEQGDPAGAEAAWRRATARRAMRDERLPDEQALIDELAEVSTRDDADAASRYDALLVEIKETAVQHQLANQHWRAVSLLGRARETVAPRKDFDRSLALALGAKPERIFNWADALGVRPNERLLAEAEADLRRAVAVDPDLADAHWDLAVVEARFRGDYDAAARHLATARGLGYLHPSMRRLERLIAERPTPAAESDTPQRRLRSLLIDLAEQARGPVIDQLTSPPTTATAPKAGDTVLTFSDYVREAQSLAADPRLSADDLLGVLDDTRAITGDSAEYVSDLLRRVAEDQAGRGADGRLVRQTTQRHLEVLRDMAFALAEEGRRTSDPARVRRSLHASQRGLAIVAASSASVEPDLHADLLLAEGSALWSLQERNVVATFARYRAALGLKRRAGNDADIERLTELLWRQIDHQVTVMESVGLLGGEVDLDILGACVKAADDLDDSGRWPDVRRRLKELHRQVRKGALRTSS